MRATLELAFSFVEWRLRQHRRRVRRRGNVSRLFSASDWPHMWYQQLRVQLREVNDVDHHNEIGDRGALLPLICMWLARYCRAETKSSPNGVELTNDCIRLRKVEIGRASCRERVF